MTETTTTAAADAAPAAVPTSVAANAAPSIIHKIAVDGEAVYHAVEAGLKSAIAEVEAEAPKVESAISGVLSAWIPGWAKLAAKWATFSHKKKVYASAFIALAGLVVWHFGVETIYNLLPDHVTHHEVRSASADAVTTAVTKVSHDNAETTADLTNVKEDVGQLKLELKAVQDALQTMARAPSPVATASVPEKKPVPPKKTTHRSQHRAEADNSSGLSAYLPSWAK